MRNASQGASANELRAAMRDVAYLASCALRNVDPQPERARAMNLALVYAMARKHQMEGICGMALERAGVGDARFEQGVARAVRRAVLLGREWDLVRARLDDEGIWYVPLKGTVLRDLYPALGMRQMADVDVLFDVSRAADVRRIMEGLGHTTVRFARSYHDVYHKPPVSNFEMHRSLFDAGQGQGRRFHKHYAHLAPERGLVRVDGGRHEYAMSAEGTYTYLVAHEYKHFAAGGTGLRSFMDLYVFWQNVALDQERTRRELTKLGIASFEEDARRFALHLFGSSESLGAEEALLEYVTFSSTYGSRAQYARNTIEKLGGGVAGRARYVWQRLFPPLSYVNAVHPFFYDHKALLPLLPAWRLARSLARSRGAVLSELRELGRRNA